MGMELLEGSETRLSSPNSRRASEGTRLRTEQFLLRNLPSCIRSLRCAATVLAHRKRYNTRLCSAAASAPQHRPKHLRTHTTGGRTPRRSIHKLQTLSTTVSDGSKFQTTAPATTARLRHEVENAKQRLPMQNDNISLAVPKTKMTMTGHFHQALTWKRHSLPKRESLRSWEDDVVVKLVLQICESNYG